MPSFSFIIGNVRVKSKIRTFVAIDLVKFRAFRFPESSLEFLKIHFILNHFWHMLLHDVFKVSPSQL
jgi:hypothetical protein